MSEVANRAANGLVSLGAGLLGLPGVWLGVATAAGFISKLLVVGGSLRSVSFAPVQAALTGRTRIRAQGLERLLGSMILSHGMLAMTTLGAPDFARIPGADLCVSSDNFFDIGSQPKRAAESGP